MLEAVNGYLGISIAQHIIGRAQFPGIFSVWVMDLDQNITEEIDIPEFHLQERAILAVLGR